MPFIRVTRTRDDVVMDININRIESFSQEKGNKFTTLCLQGESVYHVNDTPRSIRGYIKKAEGLLPEKEEIADAPAFEPELPPGL